MNNDVIKDTVIDVLTTLYKHDLAAVEIYKTVMSHVTDKGIHRNLKEFMEDHERHLQDISALIADHDGEKPSDWRDLKGYMMELYTTMRSLTGQSGALKALHTAETTVRDVYAGINVEGLDETITDLIEKNTQDEKKHMAYLDCLNI